MTLSTEHHHHHYIKEVKSEPDQAGRQPAQDQPEQGPRFEYKNNRKKKQMKSLYCYCAYKREQKALLAFKMDRYFAEESKLTAQDRREMLADYLRF
jgi:hypothetical protein